MNYYTPYFNMYPNTVPLATTTSRGLFSRLFGRLNFGSILNNTQKTLNIVNQAIPVIKQVSPVIKNAKTMFRIMNEFKREDNQQNNNMNIEQNTQKNNSKHDNYNDGPTFFIN